MERQRGDGLEGGAVHVGGREAVLAGREDARRVQRHVAVADDDGVEAALGAQRLEGPLAAPRRLERLRVVPRHKLACREHPSQVLARQAEAAAAVGAAGEHHRVERAQEPPQRHRRRAARAGGTLAGRVAVAAGTVADDDGVAQEGEPLRAGYVGKLVFDVFDLWVVRRHAEAHEAAGRRPPLQHRHGHVLLGLEQVFGDVEPRGPGTDDADARRRAARAAPDGRAAPADEQRAHAGEHPTRGRHL
mmetsp:Transcript_15229/g.54184  ORF Transcript_15229/g.54184 Transcript_15229/m.54184 type:complete len:246 (+) Transcript_15229:669-1406(+)